jgi:hypothetical protein
MLKNYEIEYAAIVLGDIQKARPGYAEACEAYRLWAADSFHPSLRFKCINHEEDIWSVRITLGVRSLGVLDGDTVTWFWVGDHDDYKRFFG